MVGTNGLVQPGLKVRGREYLRIIYGADYTVNSIRTVCRNATCRPQTSR